MKSPTWMSETEPDPVPISAMGWGRVAWRGILMGGYTFAYVMLPNPTDYIFQYILLM